MEAPQNFRKIRISDIIDGNDVRAISVLGVRSFQGVRFA